MKKWLKVVGGTTEELESALLQAIPFSMIFKTLSAKTAKTLGYNTSSVMVRTCAASGTFNT